MTDRSHWRNRLTKKPDGISQNKRTSSQPALRASGNWKKIWLVSQPKPSAQPHDSQMLMFQTADGIQWNGGIALLDNISLCHRRTEQGIEFGIVQRCPFNGINEIVKRGNKVTDVLRTFARELRQALQIWEEDVSAQVLENLAEKYPGQDMSRVAAGFVNRFSHPISPHQKINSGHQQKRSRGIGI